MTIESATAVQPYVTTDLPTVNLVDSGLSADLYLNLRHEHFALHPDHEAQQYPDSCLPCSAIVEYRDLTVRYPVSPYGDAPDATVFCSECGVALANQDLLAEHQATVHRFTDDFEPDPPAPLEDQLATGIDSL
jgi:hypothetical protein